MSHLTAEEIVDAVDRPLASHRQAHVSACVACRAQLEDLRATLLAVQAVDVPEPSPLFWDRLSDRVRHAVAVEPARPPRPARWFHWPVLAPLAGLAMLVMALGVTLTPQDVPGTGVASMDETMDEPLPALDAGGDEEAQWSLLAALIEDADLDADDQGGVRTVPGAADQAVFELTSTEQQELVRLLQAELGTGG